MLEGIVCGLGASYNTAHPKGRNLTLSYRASIVIAGHNEGDNLLRTVRSCVETTEELNREIVVADDASTDDSIETLRRHFPRVRVFTHEKRRGCSPTKDLAARKARGRTLVFVDAHCKPEPWAIERLVNDVEDSEAIVTPRVPALDCESWENSEHQVGYGYRLNLESIDSGWIGLGDMRPRDRFYESPALIGCCLAVSRRTYLRLWGFDAQMVEWGVEDIDFGLKAWLLGYEILHNPQASIGHRFRSSFDSFSVTNEAILCNKLRMARKNFTDAVWEDWVKRARAESSVDLWDAGWARFSERRESVEQERRYLFSRRVRDEFAYASHFGLAWPVGT